MIDRVDRDAFGRKLPDSTRREMYRLRKWQKRTRVYKSADRNLAQAMGELERLRDKVYVSKQVQEEAAVIYRKALDKGLIRGRSIAAIAAAALYAACRYTGTSRTLKTIAKASLVDKKDVGRCYRLLLRELEIKMPVADSISYVSKIAEPLKISGETQGKAIQIIRGFKKKLKTGGKNPQGLAGAALYIACEQNNEKRIQKDIAEIAGVTEVTIRNLYKAIKRTLKIQLND